MAKLKNSLLLLAIIVLVLIFAGCDTNGGNNNQNNPQPAIVNFFNSSSFTVDIFKNFNPAQFDPTTHVATVPSGATVRVEQFASRDQLIGDTFYVHYRVLLANSLQTGTTNIYVPAERTMSHLAFVIENGRTYTKTIPQPSANDLRFMNGYILVQNMSAGQIQIQNAGAILQRLGDNAVWLAAGGVGYYELSIPFLMESQNMNFLRVRDHLVNNIEFPGFEMERGRLYSFTVNNDGSVTGPVITNINPLGM